MSRHWSGVGVQGRFDVFCYANGATVPSTPTGGSYVVSTGVLAVPTGTTAAPVEPPANQFSWVSRATINPFTQSGTVTPTWSAFTTDVEASLAARAEAAETGAETAQTAAEAAQTAAETAQTGAETAETGAETAQTAAEAAVAGAETALASSGAALAFNELWSGDIAIATANQWNAVGTEAVPANATWLIWNGGAFSDGVDDGPAALSTWINAAAWRALTADTVGSTPGDGTGMLIVDWGATNIGDGTPDFARRDAVIGRTAANIPLILSTNTGEAFYGASLRYITQAVATPGNGGGGASSFSELSGQIADSQVPAAFTRDTELGTAAMEDVGTAQGDIPVLGTGGRLVADRISTAIARLANPTFTGTPSGPTAAAGTDTTQFATTAFVINAVLAGDIVTSDADGNLPDPADNQGRLALTDSGLSVSRNHPADAAVTFKLFGPDRVVASGEPAISSKEMQYAGSFPNTEELPAIADYSVGAYLWSVSAQNWFHKDSGGQTAWRQSNHPGAPLVYNNFIYGTEAEAANHVHGVGNWQPNGHSVAIIGHGNSQTAYVLTAYTAPVTDNWQWDHLGLSVADVLALIDQHNEATDAHQDIRDEIDDDIGTHNTSRHRAQRHPERRVRGGGPAGRAGPR